MKFSDLAARLKGVERADAADLSAQSVSEIQETFLHDIAGADGWETGGGTSGGSSSPPIFNAFAKWGKSF